MSPVAWEPPEADPLTTGELVTVDDYLNPVANALLFLEEIARVEFTSPVSITATTEGTANQVVSAGAIALEAVPHRIEFWCPSLVAPAAAAMFVIVRDATTVLGRLAPMNAATIAYGFHGLHHLTPTAASHTFNIAAHVGSGTGTVSAGAGGPGTNCPGFIRVTRIPT